MPTVTLQGFAITNTTYSGSATFTLTISEGSTLSYAAVPLGVTNLFGITEVDFTSSAGAWTSSVTLNGGAAIPTAIDDETYIYQLNLSTGPVTILQHYDSSTGIDYIFSLSGSGSLPTSQGELDALLASINTSLPAQAVPSPYAPGEAIDPTSISGATINQSDTFSGTDDAEYFDGGSGADDLDGNGGNDTLKGGSGNDTLNGGSGEDRFIYSGGADVIEDFSGDILEIDPSVMTSNLNSVLASATVVSGNLVLDFGAGNTLTLNGITDVAALDGRIQGVSLHDPYSDLTGDGTSDILWRNGTTGQFGMFDMSGGTPTWSVLGSESTAWQIAGSGDFDGDGTDDILWRNDTSGGIGFSAMGTGSPVWNALGTAGAEWQIMGVGDFNGDGTDDILWQNSTTGGVGMFAMSGGTASWQTIGASSAPWEIVATGDITGDGIDDIIWRNSTTGQVGQFAMSGAGTPTWSVVANVSTDWRLVGTGDLDGDGTDDLLWRHESSGAVGYYAMGSGSPVWQGLGQASFDWDIVGVGDYNGDGTDDILWRNVNTGSVGMYDMAGGTPSWQTIGQAGLAWDVEGQFVDEFVF